MTHHKCKCCGNSFHWHHAFAKFGYDDGDGLVQTPLIAKTLEDAGYQVKYIWWKPHNMIIYSIKKDGIELMPGRLSEYRIGYDDPSQYLPAEIIELLNDKFPPEIIFNQP